MKTYWSHSTEAVTYRRFLLRTLRRRNQTQIEKCIVKATANGIEAYLRREIGVVITIT